jgi:hypothetical protein
LLEDIAQCCIKVYTLEKVLKMKKVANPNSGVGSGGLANTAGDVSVLEDIKDGSFLDECLEIMEEKPTFTFWTTLATSLDTQTRAICEGETNYPPFGEWYSGKLNRSSQPTTLSSRP